MNIFENYSLKINKIILDNKDTLKLKDLTNLKNVHLEVPPEQFNFDLSSNISLVLSKGNNLAPLYLANNIKKLLINNISHFENIEVARPGFLNIKLSRDAFVSNIKEILKNKDAYGSKNLTKYLI